MTFIKQLIKEKDKREKKKKNMSVLSIYISIKYIYIYIYIVNLTLNRYNLLYMDCELCYFYFLNLIHEN